jgi:NMD protein affecting ribosome stability and mRNA decay
MKGDRGVNRVARHELARPERVEDSYKSPAKLSEPTRCPDCGAVYQKGRWTWSWEPSPGRVNEARCPACQRIADRYPAGYVTLSGSFFAAHRDDILNLVKNCEAREKEQHPLERIIAVEDGAEGTEVTTTSVHLARLIADSVNSAYKGELDLRYNKEDNLFRAHWSRAE